MTENKITINELIEELKKYINGPHNYNMSATLKNILDQNNDIEPKEYFIKFFSFLENTIPEKEKENFYRNLKTLKIKLNFDCFEIDSQEGEFIAIYKFTNKIETEKPSLKMLLEISLNHKNPVKFFIEVLEGILLHELCHMASTKYNDKKIPLCSGFSTIGFENKKLVIPFIGLIEGMTEVISWEGNPNTFKLASGYYVEALFVIQLMQIVGRNLMLESYFGNKGIIKIERELDNFSNGVLKSDVLLSNIEENYHLWEKGNITKKTSIISSIQNTLMEYYKNKMLYLIENNLITKEEVENSLAVYEEALIRPEAMKARTGNIEIYLGLDESIEKFGLVKQEIISMLSSNYTKKRAL